MVRLPPMSGDQLAPGGPGAVETRRRHVEAMGAEWRRYRQGTAYKVWEAQQRTDSLRIAYSMSPDFRPY